MGNALRAAAIFAIDPAAIGGVLLQARPGPARERWLAALREMLPAPPRKMPVHVDDERLLGGLDLAATLHSGRPVVQRGLLAEADGGVLLLAMAERMTPALAARLAGVMDTGSVPLQRDGLALAWPSRFGLVALDEGVADDERVPSAVAERLAIHLRLEDGGPREDACAFDIEAARQRLPQVMASHEDVEALCATALALGIVSLRAPLLALRVARAAAALDGRLQVVAEDVEYAAGQVLAPRARSLPAARTPEPPPGEDAANNPEPPPNDDTARAPEPPPSKDSASNAADSPEQDEIGSEQALPESVLEAALSALPPGLLLRLQAGVVQRRAPSAGGRSGAAMKSRLRGRPIGSERGDPRSGARLDLLATLRAAAPWQSLRRQESGRDGLQMRRDDFRVRRHRQRRQTTTIFAVDASGSAALHRLAEAKGAVELLLADCYVRRDQVALLAFRGTSAELLLPPTRSLPRVKRCLAALPGGGGTPLAAGIIAARTLAETLARQGGSTSVVMLTDGRANIARDGSPGRAAAQQDALAAARCLRASGVSAILLDTSPQPHPMARELAVAMGATYLALPHADATQMSRAVAAAAAVAAVSR